MDLLKSLGMSNLPGVKQAQPQTGYQSGFQGGFQVPAAPTPRPALLWDWGCCGDEGRPASAIADLLRPA